jgi:hypothetical protein
MPVRLTAFLADGPARRQVFFEGRSHVVGRDPSADMVLPDVRVSRRHLRLHADDGRWRIEDLASKNGTRLDGHVLGVVTVTRNAWLSLGGLPVYLERMNTEIVDQQAALAREREETALRLRQRLRPQADFAELLTDCLAAALDLSGCERGSIWLVDEGGHPKAVIRQGDAPAPESHGVIRQVLARGEALVSSDVHGVRALAERESIAGGGIRALLCLPLAVSGAIWGVLYADSQTPGKIFTQLDIDLLQGVADEVALTLAIARQRHAILALGHGLPAGPPFVPDQATVHSRTFQSGPDWLLPLMTIPSTIAVVCGRAGPRRGSDE